MESCFLGLKKDAGKTFLKAVQYLVVKEDQLKIILLIKYLNQ